MFAACTCAKKWLAVVVVLAIIIAVMELYIVFRPEHCDINTFEKLKLQDNKSIPNDCICETLPPPPPPIPPTTPPTTKPPDECPTGSSYVKATGVNVFSCRDSLQFKHFTKGIVPRTFEDFSLARAQWKVIQDYVNEDHKLTVGYKLNDNKIQYQTFPCFSNKSLGSFTGTFDGRY
jgi:hypothetical protein